MKRVPLCVVTAILTLGSLGALEPLPLGSKADLIRESSSSALLVFLSLDCDVGSYASELFASAFHDLSGVKAGLYDVNTFPWDISDNHAIDLGALLVINKGKVVASSADDPANQFDFMGFNGMRAWLVRTLKSLSIPFGLKDPGIQRAPPLMEGAEAIDLEKGLAGRFLFDDTRDSSPAGSRLTQGMPSGIHNGIYSDDGSYTNDKHPLTIFNNTLEPEAYTRGFAFAFNVRLSSVAQPWSKSGVFFSGGYRTFTVGKSPEGILFFLLEPSRMVNPKQAGGEKVLWEHWSHMVALRDKPVAADTWVHVIFTGDYRSKRMKLMINGQRLDDAVLPDELIRLLSAVGRSWSASQVAELGMLGRGAILYGDMDDLCLFNRSLGSSEMEALARRDSKAP